MNYYLLCSNCTTSANKLGGPAPEEALPKYIKMKAQSTQCDVCKATAPCSPYPLSDEAFSELQQSHLPIQNLNNQGVVSKTLEAQFINGDSELQARYQRWLRSQTINDDLDAIAFLIEALYPERSLEHLKLLSARVTAELSQHESLQEIRYTADALKAIGKLDECYMSAPAIIGQLITDLYFYRVKGNSSWMR